MKPEVEQAIDKAAKEASHRILLSFFLSGIAIVLTLVAFPTKIILVSELLLILNGFNLGILGGILIIDSKIKKFEAKQQ